MEGKLHERWFVHFLTNESLATPGKYAWARVPPVPSKGSPSPCMRVSNLMSMCTLPKSLCSKVKSVTSAHTLRAFLISESTSLFVSLFVDGYLEILYVNAFTFHLEPATI